MRPLPSLCAIALGCSVPPAFAGPVGADALTGQWVGAACLALFALAYGLVMLEERIHLKKSKPVLVAAGVIWMLIALASRGEHAPEAVESAARTAILEYAEVLLFLIVAMTYVNAMAERNVFEALRGYLVRRGFGYRALFWITGGLAFCISPVLDNLTTALVLAAVLLAVAPDDDRFILLGCINIVVAANAGGAFSPFGDITTLMVWQAGKLPFAAFFALLVPSLVNYLVPAVCLHFAVPQGRPAARGELVGMKVGGRRTILLFLATIVTAVLFHNLLHLPPVLGMMTGLGYLGLLAYWLGRKVERPATEAGFGDAGDVAPFDVFRYVARSEWDTLLFFYGVILCVSGLGFLGFLGLLSSALYVPGQETTANVVIGLLSAVVDNIPIMVAVLQMSPAMSDGQWLLVTLTAGVGGSLLSIGSAAGVALMGQAAGRYTFLGHLRWSWAVALGYAGAVICHRWWNAALF